MEVYKCTPETAKAFWRQVEPWLLNALKVAPPWWTIEELYEKTMKGDYVMALMMEGNEPQGVALAELEKYPKAIVCNVPWIGGSRMSQWLPQLQETIEEWAKKSGATYLAGAGRRGWVKAAGMKEVGTILIKEI